MTINLKFPFSRFIVRDHSMLPAFGPGDHVLTFNWGKIKKGDVVVFSFLTRHPALDAGSRKRDSRFRGNDKKGLFYIKRINKISDGFYVVGDNKKESTKLGPIKREQLVGKVVLKY